MQIQISGWKKVYFYYGAIFFGLGLLGSLLNSRLSLPELAGEAFERFSVELAEAGLIRPREVREVTVSSPRLASVVLVSEVNERNDKYEALNKQVQLRIEERARVIRYVASEKEWFNSPQMKPLLNNQQFLIGWDRGGKQEGLDGSSMVFSIPKMMAAEFFSRLTNQRPEAPLFNLELISGSQNALYRISFEESSCSFNHWIRVIDILLDIWETSLRRGNFGETLW